jgi:hypothetical protein
MPTLLDDFIHIHTCTHVIYWWSQVVVSVVRVRASLSGSQRRAIVEALLGFTPPPSASPSPSTPTSTTAHIIITTKTIEVCCAHTSLYCFTSLSKFCELYRHNLVQCWCTTVVIVVAQQTTIATVFSWTAFLLQNWKPLFGYQMEISTNTLDPLCTKWHWSVLDVGTRIRPCP